MGYPPPSTDKPYAAFSRARMGQAVGRSRRLEGALEKVFEIKWPKSRCRLSTDATNLVAYPNRGEQRGRQSLFGRTP